MRLPRWLSLSELYMWLGAIFVLTLLILVEVGDASSINPGVWGTFISQVSATLIGAGIAGGVAYTLARSARNNLKKDAAVRLIFKLKFIADDYHSILKSIDESLQEANADEHTHLRMWERVRPVVGIGEPHIIDTDEAAPFLAGGEADLANRALLLSIRHATFLRLLNKYAELREEMADFLPPTSVEGARAVTDVPPEKRNLFKLKSNELEALVREMVKGARTDLQDAVELCDLVGPAARRVFGSRDLPSLHRPV